jgi:hypothetical protein
MLAQLALITDTVAAAKEELDLLRKELSVWQSSSVTL